MMFSVGKECHYEWYCRLLKQADVEDVIGKLDKLDAVATALHSKKKTASFAYFTIPASSIEDLLGLETSTSTSLQDQMTMWLDRILDGTAEKSYLLTWPSL